MQKIILVTGGNRGIGKEICKQLGEQGHHVILGSRERSKGQTAAKELGGKVQAIKLDVTDKKDIEAAAAQIEAEFGKLDVLINNAGIFGDSSLLTLPQSELERTMETNVYAPLEMVQVFTPLLEKSSDPRVVNLSSAMGKTSEMTADNASYRLSKWSLNGLTMQMANSLPNFKVNAMHPGWVKTDMGGEQAALSIPEGADTAVWLATTDDTTTGKFFNERKVMEW